MCSKVCHCYVPSQHKCSKACRRCKSSLRIITTAGVDCTCHNGVSQANWKANLFSYAHKWKYMSYCGASSPSDYLQCSSHGPALLYTQISKSWSCTCTHRQGVHARTHAHTHTKSAPSSPHRSCLFARKRPNCSASVTLLSCPCRKRCVGDEVAVSAACTVFFV